MGKLGEFNHVKPALSVFSLCHIYVRVWENLANLIALLLYYKYYILYILLVVLLVVLLLPPPSSSPSSTVLLIEE